MLANGRPGGFIISVEDWDIQDKALFGVRLRG
jgi:hypothetical protein